MSKNNKIFVVFFIIFLMYISYIRDFVFKNINALLSHKLYQSQTNYSDEFFSFLFELNYPAIYFIKWILLFIFSVLFFISSLFILRNRFFSEKRLVTKYLILTYVVLGGISALTVAMYYIPQISEASYLVSRRVLGILHSPIPVMILFLIFYIQEKLEKNA